MIGLSGLFLTTIQACRQDPLTAAPAGTFIPAPALQPDEEASVELKILALGDSYTIGESVPEIERWPVQLAAALRENGLMVVEPQIIATTGWTTAELMAGIRSRVTTPPYDLVTLLIGVNNQYRGHAPEEYRIAFSQLLQLAIDFAGSEPQRVIVLSIPDWGMTPFAQSDARSPETITEQIQAFNRVNFELSTAMGVQYVDIFPISQQAYTDDSLIAKDELHPSGAQYALWAQAVLPAALEILR